MSHEAAVAFLQGIDEAVVTAVEGSPDPFEALTLAGANTGHEFTVPELKSAIADLKGELPEAELDKVAGGVPEISPMGLVTLMKVLRIANSGGAGPGA